MLAEKTVKIRHKIAYASMQLLAPKLKVDLQRAHKLICNDTPRPFTKMLKETYGNHLLRGCEIGFGHGANAESLLKELKLAMLYCVDPYFGNQSYLDTGVKVDWFLKEKKEDFDQQLQKMWNYPNVHLVYASSDDVFNQQLIPNNLDFIYIDGCHTYEYCLRDIINSMRYVSVGGYVGGHDFANGSLVGVEQAVFEYTRLTGIKPTCVFPDFWFQRVK